MGMHKVFAGLREPMEMGCPAVETVLEMKGISKIFPGVRALDTVDFELYRGECHALIGENGAGKSTLMKILLGIYTADEGQVLYKGQPVSFKSPRDALAAGISMIHQEISLVPTTTVAENVWTGREGRFSRLGFIDYKAMHRATKELLADLGIEIDTNALVSTLSVAQMQLVEIARAVSNDSDIVIMDEPTSALTTQEIDLLYTIIRGLLAKGVSVIFISHKLDEIFEICSRITILRDGQFVATVPAEEIDQAGLIKHIAGREIQQVLDKRSGEFGDTILEVENLCSEGVFRDVNFSVRAGEILGFCGLMGAGRSEIMRAVFGIDKYSSGSIRLNGKDVKIRSPQDAIENGMAMVTEDRLRTGALHGLSIKMNTSVASLKEFQVAGVMRAGNEIQRCTDMTSRLSVSMVSLQNSINSLSGGNQQKVILGRWLMTEPKLLILDEPTRGIDVGAKFEIYKLIQELADAGMAILLVSSEMPEILNLSDRILVVREGRIVYECENDNTEGEELLAHAFGVVGE